MTRNVRSSRIWYLAPVGLVALLLVIVLVLLRPGPSALNALIRGAALLGYLSLLAAIVSSAYMRELVRFFGRPFVQVHHVLSVAGLILIVLHPLAVALDQSSLGVLIPTVSSWKVFLTNGGRPAWYLIVIASLAGLLRTRIGKRWKLIHYLNYLAFWLATVHAVRLGEDGQLPAIRVVFVVAALGVLAVWVLKQIAARKRRSAKQKRG